MSLKRSNGTAFGTDTEVVSTSGYGKAGRGRANGVSESTKTRYRGTSKRRKEVHITDEMLAGERAVLLAERQSELEGTSERHDTLVRELFQLEGWKSLLGYNPEVAKTDNTQVFQEFKARYDLLDHATPTSSSTRQTRHSRTQRRQMISSVMSSSSTEPIPNGKPKQKSKAHDEIDIWDVLATARRSKGKGKGKEKLEEAVEVGGKDEPTIPEVAQPSESVSAPVQTRRYGRGNIVGLEKFADVTPVETAPADTIVFRSRRGGRQKETPIEPENVQLVVNHRSEQQPAESAPIAAPNRRKTKPIAKVIPVDAEIRMAEIESEPTPAEELPSVSVNDKRGAKGKEKAVEMEVDVSAVNPEPEGSPPQQLASTSVRNKRGGKLTSKSTEVNGDPEQKQIVAPLSLIKRGSNATPRAILATPSFLSGNVPLSTPVMRSPEKHYSVVRARSLRGSKGKERLVSQETAQIRDGETVAADEAALNGAPIEESISAVVQRGTRTKRRRRTVVEKDQATEKLETNKSIIPLVNGRKAPLFQESVAISISRRSGRAKGTSTVAVTPRKTRGSVANPLAETLHPSQDMIAPSTSSPSKFNIKRIKLIVRRPPLTYSNPRQRPPLPKHNDSISEFLDSYITLNNRDVDEETFRQETFAEAAIRERVELFRRQGRFIPGTHTIFGHKPPEELYEPPKRTSTDPWDAILEDVANRRRLRARYTTDSQVAAQVAEKVKAHWAKKDLQKEKDRMQEERALRQQAKALLTLVTDEWKKTVYHIQKKEREKIEAEERRLGHAHLDAILDQSGQILEAQHGHLSRAGLRSHSRSSSMSEHLRRWGSDDEDEESEENGDDEEEEEEGFEVLLHVGDDDDDGERESDIEDSASIILRKRKRDRSPATVSGSPVSRLSEALDADTSTSNLLHDVEPTDDEESFVDRSSVIAMDELILSNITGSSLTPSSPKLSALNLTNYATSDSEPSSPVLSLKSTALDDEPDQRLAPTTRASASISTTSRSRSRSVVNGIGTVAEIDVEMDEPDVDTPAIPFVEQDHDEPAEVNFDDERLPEDDNEEKEVDVVVDAQIPEYLKPYATAPIDWDPDKKITPPTLLRGSLRPYQQSGLEWLASLHTNNLNGILADEMGLGKTIQTISLLAHLACDRGIWGPHLVVVPTSVLLNWEMEFKKFLPGFKVLSYHGSTTRRKELRKGWNDKYRFNVCVTSYALASRDSHIFKRKAWYYMILDEAHMIKNFKSQRWNILLGVKSFRRLLLTGTPLQNNLTELWALLQFLMSGSNFANLKEFGEWFSNPLEKAIEMGNFLDDETMQRVSKLHTVLRPYLLRRLKRDVEKELPSKYEHLVLCPLSKRQRFLYDEFMSRAQTRDALQSGVYQKIANILMQLRKVCNHPDLFEVRPIVTSFATQRSSVADFEIKELLVRKRLLEQNEEVVNLDILGLRFIELQNTSFLSALETRKLDATTSLPHIFEVPGEPPPKDTRTIAGYRLYAAYQQRATTIARWAHTGYINRLRCNRMPVYSTECLSIVQTMYKPILPMTAVDTRFGYLDMAYRVNHAVKSYVSRAEELGGTIDRFAFATPPVVALNLPQVALPGFESYASNILSDFDAILHRASVKLQIAFPDLLLLQFDCGKLQKLASLLREKKAGGHRVLIFTQMTKILDILEIFLNFHGYLYLRLDGATKIEDRQYITERFNADSRVFCFIASSRSGGVGINLTGADTVVFYDSDFNPQMDRQCEDRAHRIGQIRDVHIYRFVSQHTVEEAMLLKANQKRHLDDLVIQKGEFDWRSLFNDESALTKALGEFEDKEDARAAQIAAKEEIVLGHADEDDFNGDDTRVTATSQAAVDAQEDHTPAIDDTRSIMHRDAGEEDEEDVEQGDDEEEGGTVVDYMLTFVERDWEFFKDWRL
ncbi:SNF2 family N-terminal domain-containing protein [Crucibulum laeve]|uniref:Helicase SWR1 n=1 Tax=Crucibulum laeve TaxID=68775 RepID=A0A5C3MK29_9AGAR|nr:SNF2 family N-terminal domain-containing protein [Crucibulum laeve]